MLPSQQEPGARGTRGPFCWSSLIANLHQRPAPIFCFGPPSGAVAPARVSVPSGGAAAAAAEDTTSSCSLRLNLSSRWWCPGPDDGSLAETSCQTRRRLSFTWGRTFSHVGNALVVMIREGEGWLVPRTLPQAYHFDKSIPVCRTRRPLAGDRRHQLNS